MTRPKKDAEELDASQKLKEEGYSGGSFIIECFYFHFDGTRFGPVNATFQIRKFEGERGVKSLPIVPLVCYANAGNIRKRLEERGDKFAKLSNPKATAHRKYKGLTLDKNQEQVRTPRYPLFFLSHRLLRLGRFRGHHRLRACLHSEY